MSIMYVPTIRPKGDNSGRFDAKITRAFPTKQEAEDFARLAIADDWEKVFSFMGKSTDDFEILLTEYHV